MNCAVSRAVGKAGNGLAGCRYCLGLKPADAVGDGKVHNGRLESPPHVGIYDHAGMKGEGVIHCRLCCIATKGQAGGIGLINNLET